VIIIIKVLLVAISLVILGITVPKVLVNNKLQRNNNTASVQGKKTQLDVGNSGNSNKYLGNSINKLQQVQEKSRNKEIKSQVSEVIEEEEQSDEDIGNSIKSMEGRPSYLKFIMGPDYKNAGQVRSEIVHLRNQISKLDRIQDRAGATESGTIADTIDTLQAELVAIETKLYENLQGFSLLGWLSKLLTGFSLPSVSPSPSGTPVITPTESPIPTLEPSPTPEPTVTP
jgi:uncharacterized protein YoxC